MDEERATARAKLSTGEVYEELRAQILANRIPPGTRVNIEAVSRSLGVSPTPVREALHRLQGDNLVVATSGRGYSTTALLDLAGLRELFEFRLLVEPWAARSVAVDRLDNPARRLARELDEFEAHVGDVADIRSGLVGHDARFHDLILSATGNRVVQGAYAQTHCHLHMFRLYPADIGGEITHAEHRAVWEAIRDCDAGQAEEAMRQHLTQAFMRFAQAFEEGQPHGLQMRQPPSARTRMSS
ncbi:GntR family transcriptional regulator [Arthrobacter sp. KK5.5]|uniref:GntR family transcriptional regulator n=1 Tax=Arthrobacter sp. KK5.5 TaxID=3373084 RepID=UPI003EE72284